MKVQRSLEDAHAIEVCGLAKSADDNATEPLGTLSRWMEWQMNLLLLAEVAVTAKQQWQEAWMAADEDS